MADDTQTAITVRFAREDDAVAITEFNRSLALETESKELDSERVAAGVLRALQSGDEIGYVVAEAGARRVGCLMFTREWSDWRNGWFLWLQSVYVLPEYRGRGVFRAMCDRVLQMAHDNPEVVGVRLYVHDENTRAQQVYRQAGFTDPQYRVLEKHTGN